MVGRIGRNKPIVPNPKEMVPAVMNSAFLRLLGSRPLSDFSMNIDHALCLLYFLLSVVYDIQTDLHLQALKDPYYINLNRWRCLLQFPSSYSVCINDLNIGLSQKRVPAEVSDEHRTSRSKDSCRTNE